ncbi:ABC-type polysaccharide transportsystem,permease component [Enterococcus sp. HSIEG1]|nr:ABC-type polysaccharide transportsystem,permease component [Enterococcus sp. HSIEG1]
METTTIREPVSASKSKIKEMKTKLKKSRQLYLFVLPAFLIILIFSYGPMYGVIIAFKDYMPSLGIFESPWVGFKHFQRFFDSYYFWDLMKNTLGISLYSLIVGFPLPIILALALNEIKDGPFKKLPRQSRMPQTLSQ